MVYGIAKMLNFAHGDVIMVGAYVCFCSMSYLNLPPVVGRCCWRLWSAPCWALSSSSLAYKPLRCGSHLWLYLITAIGVSYFLQNAALLIWKSDPEGLYLGRQPALSGAWPAVKPDHQLRSDRYGTGLHRD